MIMKKYLIVTDEGELLAKGALEGFGADDTMRLKIVEGKEESVAAREIVQLIGSGEDEMPMQCRVLRCNDGRVLLKKLQILDPELRRNLRIPVEFDSFIYPVSGSWKGRKPLRSVDLSCGGLAFYASDGIEVGETVEVVIPKTTHPLILKMQIIRKEPLRQEHTYYAAKFVHLEMAEEHMVREAVFSIQLQNRQRTSTKDQTEG